MGGDTSEKVENDEVPTFRPIWEEVGRRLRWLTGVQEEILDEVPSERSKYNGVAWTMVGTAALATVGMALLIQLISDLPLLLVLLGALGWGAFILGIDYLVVSQIDDKTVLFELEPIRRFRSPHRQVADRTGPRQRIFVRAFLATFLGLAVGESLVLTAFKTAAEKSLDKVELARLQSNVCSANQALVVYRPAAALKDCVTPPATPAADQPASPVVTTTTSTNTTTVTTTTLEAATVPTVPKPDLKVYDTTSLEADLNEAEERVTFFVAAAACEDNPTNVPEARRLELGCTGNGGRRKNWREKIDLKVDWEKKRDDLLARIKKKDEDRQSAIDAQTVANNKLATDFAAQKLKTQADQAELDKKSKEQQAADDKADRGKRDADEKTDKDRVDAEYNSPEAKQALENQKAALQERTLFEQGKKPIYGLSERFDATESAVDWRIRWALRLLFIIVDMAPVLMKLTLSTSVVEKKTVMRRQALLYADVAVLDALEEKHFEGQEWDLPPPSPAPKPKFGSRFAFWRGKIADRVAAVDDPTPDSPGEEKDGDDEPPTADTGNRIFIDARTYIREGLVGSGAFAQVYRVKVDPSLGVRFPLVVKLPKRGSKAKELLATELQLYKQLRSGKGVTTMYGGDAKGILLRYYPRTSIDRWYFSEGSSQTFTLQDWVQWMTDISSGLQSIWSENHVHGDGKPANILLTGSTPTVPFSGTSVQENQAVVTDLGSAVEFGDRPTTYSYGFTAPEYLLKRGRSATATPFGDIYSFLGATSYYLLSGGIVPWLDQLKLRRDDLKSNPMDRVKKQWLKAVRTNPITPLRNLNAEVPEFVSAQVESWMATDPEGRLELANHARRAWAVSQYRWDISGIGGRLTEQIASLNSRLEDEADSDRHVFGTRHRLAFAPEEFPDDTFENDEHSFADDEGDDL